MFFDGLTKEQLKQIKHWIRNIVEEELKETAIAILEADREEIKEMVASNAFIVSEMKERAKIAGREQGLAEGLAEGREEGIELAKKVFKLSIIGKTKEEIARECKITVQKVEKIME